MKEKRELEPEISMEELEDNFTKVVQEIVNDKSLDVFRIEYEKLHQALIVSHDHNKILVEKCALLNKDISDNSKKIVSVISMTQSDQKTIAQLRREFERAWEIVEAAQKKEEKSKVIIYRLKEEVLNLEKLIKQGGTAQTEQKESLQSLMAGTAHLKNEIDMNENEINSLITQLDEERNAFLSASFELKENQEIIKNTENSISEVKENIADLENVLINTQLEMKRIKEEILAGEQKNTENKELIKIQTERNTTLRGEVKYHKEQFNFHAAEQENIKKNIYKLKNNLIVIQKAAAKTKSFCIERKKYYDKQELEKNGLPAELETLKNEYSEAEKKINELNEHRRNLETERADYRNKLVDLHNQSFELVKRINSTSLEKRMKRLEADQKDREIRQLSNKVAVEKDSLTAAEIETKAVQGDLTSEKSHCHNDGRSAMILEEESKGYLNIEHRARMDYISAKEQMQVQQIQLDKADIELSNIRSDIALKIKINKNLQYERDVLKNLIEGEIRTQNELQNDFDMSKSQSLLMKNDLIKLDRETAEKHLKKLQTIKEVEKLQEDVVSYRKRTEEALNRVEYIKTEIEKKYHILHQAEVDKQVITHTINSLRGSISVISNDISKKRLEADSAKSKIDAIKNILDRNYHCYSEIIKKIVEKKDELQRGVEKQRKLLEKLRYVKAMETEAIRLDKLLVQQQGMTIALEEELQRPMMINKWVFLDATNPELAQLYRLKQDILNKIAIKIGRLVKLRNKYTKLSKENARLEKRLENAGGGRYFEEKRTLTEALRMKSKQIEVLEANRYENQNMMNEKRKSIRNTREEFRKEKAELAELQMRNITVRPMTADDRGLFKPNLPRYKGENIFIGGGFAIGGFSNLPQVSRLTLSPRPQSDRSVNKKLLPSLKESSKKMPKSARNFKKKITEELYAPHAPDEPYGSVSRRKSARRIRK